MTRGMDFRVIQPKQRAATRTLSTQTPTNIRAVSELLPSAVESSSRAERVRALPAGWSIARRAGPGPERARGLMKKTAASMTTMRYCGAVLWRMGWGRN